MFHLTGKRALVTGSTQGIGYEIAKVLRTHGAEVYIHCSKDEALANAEYAKKVLSGIPTGFAGQPSDCVGAALLLCSDAGRYITGMELPVDGGMKL